MYGWSHLQSTFNLISDLNGTNILHIYLLALRVPRNVEPVIMFAYHKLHKYTILETQESSKYSLYLF